MDELTIAVAKKIGVDVDVAKKAVGAILNFLKQQKLQDLDFGKIMDKLKGAHALMNDHQAKAAVDRVGPTTAGSTTAASGSTTTSTAATTGSTDVVGMILSILKAFGLITMLKNFLQPIFGDKAVQMIESVEDGAELTSVLSNLGVTRDQGIKVVHMLVNFMKDKLDTETIDKLVDQIPAVQAFLGDAKKIK